MSYEDMEKLLNKYSTKQPGERWSSRTDTRRKKIRDKNEQIRLFEGINGEYFRLVGTQKDRAKYLIKQLNFNKINPKCTSEQIIVMICYFVKREYDKFYRRKNCKTAFKDYKVTSDTLDAFAFSMYEYGINNTIFSKNVQLKF